MSSFPKPYGTYYRMNLFVEKNNQEELIFKMLHDLQK